MKGACLLSALIYCNLSMVHFPGLSFGLKYRLVSSCFIQKLKSTQQINTFPYSPKPGRKASNIYISTEKKWKWECLTHKGITGINSFISLSEKVSQKNTNACNKHEVFCLLLFLIQLVKSNISKL